MPEYTVRDSHSGRTVTLRGDSPPTDAELEDIFSSLPSTQSAAQPTQFANVQSGSSTTAPVKRTWGQAANDALPMVGGAIGGMAGSVGGLAGSAAGAAVGGAAGKGYSEFFKHAAELPGAIKDIASNMTSGHAMDTLRGLDEGAASGLGSAAWSGTKEGVTDLAGGVVAKGATKLARGFINQAYKPTLEALEINPNIAQDILSNGISLSKKGLQKASGMTNSAKAYAESLVDDLMKGPRKFLGTPQGLVNTQAISRDAELIDPVFFAHQAVNGTAGPNAMGKVLAGADNLPGIRTAENTLDSVLKSVPDEITPRRALEIKRAEGRKAASVFTDSPDVAGRKSFNADLHDAADEALSRRIGPQWSAANKETQKALSIQKMVEDALGHSTTDSHMPLPYDQWLLIRGLSNMNVGDIGLAMAREAGRSKKLVSGAGRAIYANRNAATHAVRGVRTLANEENKAGEQRRASKASEVNSLYDRYKGQ